MVRIEKDKLILELDCRFSDPTKELSLLCRNILIILMHQDKDFVIENRDTVNQLLNFLQAIIPAGNQIINPNITKK
jgi:hypothetical protein